MKTCKYCGKQIKDTSKFCYYCGKKAEEESKRFCDECGTEITNGMTFCPECGKLVSDMSLGGEPEAESSVDNTKEKDEHFIPPSTTTEVSTPAAVDKVLPGFNYSVTSSGKYVIVSLWDKFLTEVDIPDTVEVIGPKAFEGSRVISVTLREGLRMIDDRAFADCKLLTSINIPASVNYIGDEAFVNCDKLDIQISKSISHIGVNVDLNTLSDNRVKAEKEKQRVAAAKVFKYEAIDGGRVKVVGLADESQTKLVIPEKDEKLKNVTEIAEKAFFKNKNIVEVTIPKSVTVVGKDAFAGCKNLTVKVSKNAEIGKNAFAGCEKVITY